MELLETYWREITVAGLALVIAILLSKTDTLRPAVLIFGAAAVSLAAAIDAPSLDAVKAVITGVRNTVLQQATFIGP